MQAMSHAMNELRSRARELEICFVSSPDDLAFSQFKTAVVLLWTLRGIHDFCYSSVT